MEPRIRPITIWAISATFGFFSMFAAALWYSFKSEDLETKLSTQRALHDEQEQYLARLQKRLATTTLRADQAELTLSLLTETCSSECNKTCWSQE